ncbi:hypothetical protein [Actinoplanes sp. HUAS TT8]|uniref:hypothetical protein n=1 Tax=Actinoplanes sp. HUAS TT8 TaxID=3447453 RepID=UPI003F523722
MTERGPADVGLLALLSCLVVEPRLGGVLFLDADPAAVLSVAEVLRDALAESRGRPHRTLVLGASVDDDALWSGWGLVKRESGTTVAPRPGALVETVDGATPVVVVPDLAAAGLAVRTAAVVAAGADVVHVEHNGQGVRWAPEACWLAAGRRTDLLSVSPHLLDRFPIRWSRPLPRERPDGLARALRAALRTVGAVPGFAADALGLLARAASDAPHGREQSHGPVGLRRTLAAGRVARALSRLGGATEVGVPEVERALQLLGLRAGGGPAPEPEEPRDAAAPRSEQPPIVTAAGPAAAEPQAVRARVSPPVATASERATLVDARYPEDDPRALPQPQSLRYLDPPRESDRRAASAKVSGYTAATDLRDLAIVPTLLRATLRRLVPLSDGRPRPLRILPDDLRRARRGTRPDAALVLVLDHTVRGGAEWNAALAEHLQWAYKGRAVVTLIEFGHAGMQDELRPERFRCVTVVDPQVEAALGRTPGSATPLAAAIDLAADELWRLHLRTYPPFRRIRLVVATDGRGNVPFAGITPGRIIRREGIEDALELARGSRVFRSIQTIVLAPRLDQHAELPHELAAALGGRVTTVAARKPEGRS